MTVNDFFKICYFTPRNYKIANVVGVNDMNTFNAEFKKALKPGVGVLNVDCRQYSDSNVFWHSILKAAKQYELFDTMYSGLAAKKSYVILFENIEAFDKGKPNDCLNLLCSLMKDDKRINPAICATYNLSAKLSPYFKQRLALSCLGWCVIDGKVDEACENEKDSSD